MQRTAQRSRIIQREQPVIEEAPKPVSLGGGQSAEISLGPSFELERPARYFDRPSSSKYFALTSSHEILVPSVVRRRSSAR